MSFAEMIDTARPSKIVRIDGMIPDWKPGGIYSGIFKFQVLSMDKTGMMVQILETEFDQKNEEDREEKREPMQVVPSPS